MKTYDVAVLLSGGLDSYIATVDAKMEGIDHVGIWFNIGQPYAWKEKEALDSLGVDYIEFNLDLIREEFKNVPTIEDQIIPGRNLVFVSVASMYAKTIWMGALDGEMHHMMPDKDWAFFHSFSGLATHVYWPWREKTELVTPFRSKTKAEMVAEAINVMCIPKEELFKTSTCYHPEVRKCGVCSTCVKRAMAFRLNGIEEPGYESDPFQSKAWEEYKGKIHAAMKEGDFTHYSEKRCREVLRMEELL